MLSSVWRRIVYNHRGISVYCTHHGLNALLHEELFDHAQTNVYEEEVFDHPTTNVFEHGKVRLFFVQSKDRINLSNLVMRVADSHGRIDPYFKLPPWIRAQLLHELDKPDPNNNSFSPKMRF